MNPTPPLELRLERERGSPMQTWPRRLGYARPISFSSASVTDDLGTMGIGPNVIGERKYSSNEKEVPSLIHTTPKEAPPLIGISCTWKSSMRNYTVSTTNKEVLYIVRSVRDILQRLDPKGSDQSTYIWTDQLCINQADEGISGSNSGS